MRERQNGSWCLEKISKETEDDLMSMYKCVKARKRD